MVGVMVLMVWLMNRENNRDKEILVIDRSGIVRPAAHRRGHPPLPPRRPATLDEMRREAPAGRLRHPPHRRGYHDQSARPPNSTPTSPRRVDVEQAVSDQIRRIIEDRKTESLQHRKPGYDPGRNRLSDHPADQDDLRKRAKRRTPSSILSMASGLYFRPADLHVSSFMYGTMVMQGVIEEKSNKVLEVMVLLGTPPSS